MFFTDCFVLETDPIIIFIMIRNTKQTIYDKPAKQKLTQKIHPKNDDIYRFTFGRINSTNDLSEYENETNQI